MHDRLSAPECAIVSLTVTEGGYFIEDASGGFLVDHPDIRHDLEHPVRPRTWVGYVAEACERRMKLGRGPFTLLSCDNLQANGAAARTALISFAEAAQCGSAQMDRDQRYLPQQHGRPHHSPDDRREPRHHFGQVRHSRSCPGGLGTFRQWVLEDAFAAGRPEWELAGAQITGDVAPYEMTKMRLLNGGHSAIGYVGGPARLQHHCRCRLRPATAQAAHGVHGRGAPHAQIAARHRSRRIHRDDRQALLQPGNSRSGGAHLLRRLRQDREVHRAFSQRSSQRKEEPRVLPFVIASWLHYLRRPRRERTRT